MTASMESWKIEAQNINSRCGFCGMAFDKWQDRVDHLAKEFRNGANMKQWKGCRGLDPAIAVQVTNAMPPYLISNERKSPFPFSATNSSSLKQQFLYSQPGDLEAVLPPGTLDNTVLEEGKRIGLYTPRSSGSSNHGSDSNAQSDDADTIATCWEILTLRLGRFARQYMEKHQTNTILDSILQSKARCILYGEDDPWHQTAADNPDWLSLFKQAHGIQGTYASVPAHDALEDLGIRANANLDPSFNVNNFNFVNAEPGQDAAALRSLDFECLLSGTLNMSRYGHVSVPPQMPNMLATSSAPLSQLSSMADFTSLGAPITELECPGGLGGLCLGEDGEIGLAVPSTGECSRLSLDTLGAAPTHTTPITEQNSTSLQPATSDFGLINWDQMGNDFDIAATTAAMTSDLNATSGIDFSAFSTGYGMENVPAMRWDDNELTFPMDMDMDMGINMDMDMNTAPPGSQ